MRPASPPELAVVECDGGRIRTREPGHGPGVHSSTEGWRETKNAVLIRASRTVSIDDPQPEPPACFCDSKHVAKIAETAALSVASLLPGSASNQCREDSPELAKPAKADDWRPKRLVRTVLASIAESKVFGKQMEREAKRRRFFEANAKAFLGDGLPWNWSIWKKHFPDFTPILDFIHVLSYLFLTAKAVHDALRRCMEPVPRLDAAVPGTGRWHWCLRNCGLGKANAGFPIRKRRKATRARFWRRRSITWRTTKTA